MTGEYNSFFTKNCFILNRKTLENSYIYNNNLELFIGEPYIIK